MKKKAKEAVSRIYTESGELEKPILRISADLGVCVSQDIYKDIEKEAEIKHEDGICMMGSRYKDKLIKYEDKLIKPLAKKHFQEQGFPYSAFDVEVIKKTGEINVSLWMVKSDINETNPDGFFKTFPDVSMLHLGERLNSLYELPDGMWRSKKFQDLGTLIRICGLSKPPVMKVIYHYCDDSMYAPWPCLRLPFITWGFYSEKESPEFRFCTVRRRKRDSSIK